MPLTQTPDQVFRDYNTEGVPASGVKEPVKSEVRTLLNEFIGGDYLEGEDAIPTKINLMKHFGGEPDIEDWVSDPGSVTDWAPEIENAVFQAISEGWHILRVPYHEGSASYDLLSTLELAYPIKLAGFNLSTSIFAQRHTGAGINCTGENGTGGGIYDLSIALLTAAGTPLYNIAVSAHQDSGDPQDQYAADFWELKNINCTVFGGNAPDYIYIFDGNARDDDDSGSVAIGLRNIWGERLTGFGANERSMELRKCKDPSFSKISLFGTLGNADIYVGSDSTDAGHLSEAVKMDQVLCGDLVLERLAVGQFDITQMIDLISVNTATAVLIDAAYMQSDPSSHVLVSSMVTAANWGVADAT